MLGLERLFNFFLPCIHDEAQFKIITMSEKVNLFTLSHPPTLSDCSSSFQLETWSRALTFLLEAPTHPSSLHLHPVPLLFGICPPPHLLPWVILIRLMHPPSSPSLCLHGEAWSSSRQEAACTRGGSSVGAISKRDDSPDTWFWIRTAASSCGALAFLPQASKWWRVWKAQMAYANWWGCKRKYYTTTNVTQSRCIFLYLNQTWRRFRVSLLWQGLHSLLRHARVLISTHHLFVFPLCTDMRSIQQEGDALKSITN